LSIIKKGKCFFGIAFPFLDKAHNMHQNHYGKYNGVKGVHYG